jgi:hypothetical protein
MWHCTLIHIIFFSTVPAGLDPLRSSSLFFSHCTHGPISVYIALWLTLSYCNFMTSFFMGFLSMTSLTPTSDRVQCELEMSSCRLTTAEKRASQLSQNRSDTITEIGTLELQQTEKIETEMKDVNRIRIRKVYASCPGWPSGGHKSSPVRHKYMLGSAALGGQYHNLSGTYE